MGLDITFYKSVKLIREMTVQQANAEDYDPGDRDECLLYIDHPSRTQHDGMAQGAYSHGKSTGFCAGSYSGYGAFREMLATAMGTTCAAIWKAAKRPAIPFVELINFSDCEGFMGPTTSAKLARDFSEQRPKVIAWAAGQESAEWFVKKYDEWAAGFAFVGPDGAVKFH